MSGTISPQRMQVSFGVFEFDPRTGELRKAGRRVRLSGQPATVLALLVARPGELVTREELRRELWPGDTFVDFERNLNSAIKRLRAALAISISCPGSILSLMRLYPCASRLSTITNRASIEGCKPILTPT